MFSSILHIFAPFLIFVSISVTVSFISNVSFVRISHVSSPASTSITTIFVSEFFLRIVGSSTTAIFQIFFILISAFLTSRYLLLSFLIDSIDGRLPTLSLTFF